MMEYKEELLPMAYKRAKWVIEKIDELGITSDMDKSAQDKLILSLAKAKGEQDGTPFLKLIKGQRWFVESLIKKAGLTKKELLELEYQELLPANSSFDELVGMLD